MESFQHFQLSQNYDYTPKEIVPSALKTFPDGASGKEPACQCRRHKGHGFIPKLGRFPGGGHGNPLHYSCLENPIDRGTWQAGVHRLAKESDTTEVIQHAHPQNIRYTTSETFFPLFIAHCLPNGNNIKQYFRK